MTKILAFTRGNAIALCALFIALGGTSYAAIAIPAGSVGTKQLRNGSITPVKFANSEIGGVVRAWARVSADGKLVTAHGFTRASSFHGTPSETAVLLKNFDVAGCAASAIVVPPTVGVPAPGTALAALNTVAKPYGVAVQTYNPVGQPTPLPFVVELLC
jgi:hypothetical protein